MTETKTGRTVGEMMTRDPIVVLADAPLSEAARLLDRNRISGLPVVDGTGALVGVVSHTDLLRARRPSTSGRTGRDSRCVT
jgi:CBS domain-containing protein